MVVKNYCRGVVNIRTIIMNHEILFRSFCAKPCTENHGNASEVSNASSVPRHNLYV